MNQVEMPVNLAPNLSPNHLAWRAVELRRRKHRDEFPDAGLVQVHDQVHIVRHSRLAVQNRRYRTGHHVRNV
ncbi:MAG: hypothetical protein KO463_02245, partial [Candidatus Methanofastidiosa archaeon]|nr:hypothetical protein [Candidatus Methanofastidiosa archaeon]